MNRYIPRIYIPWTIIMNLEKAIHHHFSNESQKTIAEVLFTANWLENKIAKLLDPLNLSFQQLNVLRIISGQVEKIANVQLIKERMIDNRSNVSRLLNKLCEKGFIEKDRCTEDQRVVYIKLTKAGETVMEQGKNAIESIQFSMDDDVLKQLNHHLETIRI